ncbi:hypothetical protein KC19_2G206500 [Ceratodon purpureus]|uniref:Ketoreductase domain-containing protein n=1 Tax=Ceratodon purpureus TaxID=3225 RepID=A0A8T0IXQ5_CERPU|nr:hypothetical protein KC19_2G206500 [Ceratodon purpureus]
MTFGPFRHAIDHQFTLSGTGCFDQYRGCSYVPFLETDHSRTRTHYSLDHQEVALVGYLCIFLFLGQALPADDLLNNFHRSSKLLAPFGSIGGFLYAVRLRGEDPSSSVGLYVLALWSRKKPFMADLHGKHIFLTGASRGIGLEVVKQTLREGAYLTLVARSAEKMAEVANSVLKELDLPADRVLVKAADVGDYAAISTAVKESYEWRPIDVLINNAGITRSGFMENFSVEDINAVVQTNVLGSIYPVHAVLPQLKLRSRDHPISIVFIGSLASLCWMYGNSVYTGSKYAVKGIAESLRLELSPYNIRVNLVCPGIVDTGLLDDVDNEEELTAGMKVASFYDRKQAQSPGIVAKIIIAGIKKGTFMITTRGLGLVLLVLTRGFAPSDSFLRNLVEAVCAGPLRFITFFTDGEVHRKLKMIHSKHNFGKLATST